MAAKKWDENTDYSALLNAAMESGSTDAAYMQSLLDARNEKLQDANYSKYNNPDYTASVQDYINNINKQNSSSGSSWAGGNAGYQGQYNPSKSYDYAKNLRELMDTGYSDADYLEQLLNERTLKALDNPSLSQYANDAIAQEARDYINNLRKPAYDLDSIIAQIQDAIGPEPVHSSRWDDTANLLAQAALDMSYDKWTGSDQYSALADRYGRQGQLSMQDILGQISSRTGGLASSYATTAANQQYNEYMAMLEEVARQMYNSERNDALSNAQLAMNYSDRDYDRYLDELSRYGNNRSFAYQVLADAMANSQYNQEWSNKLQQQELANQRTSQADAQNRISNYLAAGGAVSALDENLIESSGYTMPELYALEKYYADQAAAAAAKSSGSGSRSSSGGSGSGSGSGNGNGSSAGTDWADVDNWVIRFGADAGEDYVKEHYKDLGYSSQSAAIAGWNNHMREVGGMSGLQSSGSDTGNGNPDGGGMNRVPTFDDYEEAVAYMKRQGVPGTNASSAMTKSEWTRRKASLKQYGTGGTEVRDYDTYSEYLTAYTQYCIETYGN